MASVTNNDTPDHLGLTMIHSHATWHNHKATCLHHVYTLAALEEVTREGINVSRVLLHFLKKVVTINQ